MQVPKGETKDSFPKRRLFHVVSYGQFEFADLALSRAIDKLIRSSAQMLVYLSRSYDSR